MRSDPIFGGRKRRTSGWVWGLIFVIVVLLSWWAQHLGESGAERIRENQQRTIEHLKSLVEALDRWKKADYDANGKEDYPLGGLSLLRETRFVNGHSLDLISEELAKADLREQEPQPLDGYYYTLAHPAIPWPEEESAVDMLQLLAIPAEMGRTGVCTFYLSTLGDCFISPYPQNEKIPPWPTQLMLDQGIWEARDLSQL